MTKFNRIYDDYGALENTKQAKKATEYAQDRIHRLLRKLMRMGVALHDAEWTIIMATGIESNTISNQDYTKRLKYEENLKKTKRKKNGGPTGS